MIQRAGKASFTIPDEWNDESLYSYSSSDRILKITLFFDNEIDESTAEEIIRDRVETMREVLPGFRVERDTAPIVIDGREGRLIIFDCEDADEIKRTRFVAIMLGSRKALIINAVTPINRIAEMETVWNQFVSNFKFSEGDFPVTGGQNK